MKKYIKLVFLISVLFLCASSAWAISVPTPYFGAKFSDVTFTDFDYLTLSNGTIDLHPNQEPSNITGNVWGLYNLTGTYALTNNNPESNQLSAIPSWQSGSDGKFYFGVYGGLTINHIDPAVGGDLTIGLKDASAQGDGFANYLKIYEVDAADAGVYDTAVGAGPGSGKGAFGTFGNDIINNGTLWLDMVFAPDILEYYSANYQAGDIEMIDVEADLTTADATAYLNIVGGAGQDIFVEDVFPFFFPLFPARADLRAISDITANLSTNPLTGETNWTDDVWTSVSQDPITGATIPEPSTVMLLGLGLLGLSISIRKKINK